MLAHARMLVLSVGAAALAATACATVPEGSVGAAAVECPSGSECYDVPRAVGEGGQLSVDADEFFFENLSGTFWAGDIEVTINNVGDAEHNIVFADANTGSEVPQALPGESATATVNLFEGEYVYFCSIPGHRANGMEGTITIAPTEEEASENVQSPTEVPTSRPESTETEDAPTEAEGGATEGGTTDATDVEGTETETADAP